MNKTESLISLVDTPLLHHGQFVSALAVASILSHVVVITASTYILRMHLLKKTSNCAYRTWTFLTLYAIKYLVSIFWPPFFDLSILISDIMLSYLVFEFLDTILDNLMLSLSIVQSRKNVLSKNGQLFWTQKLLWSQMVFASVYYILTPIVAISTYFSMYFQWTISPKWLFITKSVASGSGILSMLLLSRFCRRHSACLNSTFQFFTLIFFIALSYGYTRSKN